MRSYYGLRGCTDGARARRPTLAGDCWDDARLAERVLPWLHRSRDCGLDILVGDPGRRYLPTNELVGLASYDVGTTTELDDLERKQGRVYALRPASEKTKPQAGPAVARFIHRHGSHAPR